VIGVGGGGGSRGGEQVLSGRRGGRFGHNVFRRVLPLPAGTRSCSSPSRFHLGLAVRRLDRLGVSNRGGRRRGLGGGSGAAIRAISLFSIAVYFCVGVRA